MDALFKEMSDIRFQDLIDLSALQNLTTSFSRLTGLATAILDLEGNVLSFSGWQEICLEFHRKNPITAKRCLESDTILAGNLAKGNHFNVYKCKNGLVDVAVPITIENIHTGNLFIGQFLFEPPDTATFAQQADQFGFDKKWYLDALSKVPIISTENLDQAIDFLKNLTTLIGSSGYDRKKLIELNKDLEFRIQERTAELAYSNEQLRVFSEASFEGIIISENLLIVEANGIMAKMFGFAKETELVGVKFTDLVSEEKRSDVNDKMVSGYDRPYETLGLKKDGAAFPIQVHGKTFVYKDQKFRGAAIRDLTEQKKAQEEIQALRGILPLCAFCKKIRNDKGYWEQVDTYINLHMGADISHSICPECAKIHYPGLLEEPSEIPPKI